MPAQINPPKPTAAEHFMTIGELNRSFYEWAAWVPNVVDREHVNAAFAIAESAHAGQYRRGGTPYIIHPLRVAHSLIHEFGKADPTIVCAALLHDVLEDSDRFTPNMLKLKCGYDVLAIVEAVTYVPLELETPEEKARDKYEKALRGGESAWWVKLADRIDNLRDTAALANTPKNEKFKARYFKESAQYLVMASRLGNAKVFNALQEALAAIEVPA